MFVAKCGGIKLNEDVFKEINGVITLSTESEVHDPVTSCGQLWDSNIFSVGKVEDRYIISMATRHEEIPLGSLIKANCSILCERKSKSYHTLVPLDKYKLHSLPVHHKSRQAHPLLSPLIAPSTFFVLYKEAPSALLDYNFPVYKPYRKINQLTLKSYG